MTDPTIEKRITRFDAGTSYRSGTSFCLMQLMGYETESLSIEEKRQDLLQARVTRQTKRMVERACNIGGCTLKVTEDLEKGRSVTGACKAASYCLKTEFEAVREQGNDYLDIVKSLESHTSSMAAGNFCPRLACDLSAGVSIDMVPGTAGECYVEIKSLAGQQKLDI